MLCYKIDGFTTIANIYDNWRFRAIRLPTVTILPTARMTRDLTAGDHMTLLTVLPIYCSVLNHIQKIKCENAQFIYFL